MDDSRTLWWTCDGVQSKLIDVCGAATHEVVQGDGYQVITLKAAIVIPEALAYQKSALMQATENLLEVHENGIKKSCQIKLVGELKSSISHSEHPNHLEMSLAGRFKFNIDDWKKLWSL